MKKVTISLLALILLTAAGTPGFAAPRSGGSYELSGSLGFATGPADFDDEWGISFGGGYMLNNMDNLQARIDISYFTFDRDIFGSSLEYTRIPVAIGGRYYIPMADRLNLFAEGAVEVSFDDAEFTNFFGQKGSDSEVNIGVTPGAGVELFVSDTVSLFTAARYHVISDDYFSLHLGGAVHF